MEVGNREQCPGWSHFIIPHDWLLTTNTFNCIFQSNFTASCWSVLKIKIVLKMKMKVHLVFVASAPVQHDNKLPKFVS